MNRLPPRSTLTDTPFPSTTLFRATIDPAPVRPGAVTRERRDSAGRRTRALPAVGDAAEGGRSGQAVRRRSEEHTSELQSLMRISYAAFCVKKTTKTAIQSQGGRGEV